MPTYEYRCPKGHEFELFQRMSDEPRAECPTCGAEAERLLSAGAGFLFKGEGFYITDYRSDSYREAAKKEGKSASPSDASSGSSDGGDKGAESGGEKKSSEKTGGEKTSGSSGSGKDATRSSPGASGSD